MVLGHPLAPEQACSKAGRVLLALGEVTILDALVVDQALPVAVREAVREPGATKDATSLPSFLHEQEGGHPVYRASSLGSRGLPRPLATVRIDEAPHEAFVVQLSRPTLERMPGGQFATGSWVMFVPVAEDSFATTTDDKVPRLLVSNNNAFNATGEHWTFGLPRLRKDKVHIRYLSHEAPAAEMARRSNVRIIGRAYGVLSDGMLKRIG